jgi:hypothetical protein
MEFVFTAPLWEYEGQGSWHFVTMPRAQSKQLREFTEGRRKVGGTAKVMARVGGSRWKTSVFWDSKRLVFLLPVKAAVRRKELLQDGQLVEVELVPD